MTPTSVGSHRREVVAAKVTTPSAFAVSAHVGSEPGVAHQSARPPGKKRSVCESAS